MFGFICDHTCICITKTGQREQTDFGTQNTNVNDNINLEHTGTLGAVDEMASYDFDQFVRVFLSLYKKYIEANRAPYEINISSNNRDQMKSYYLIIKLKQKQNNLAIMDENTFVRLWNDLNIICHELYPSLYSSILRCPAILTHQNG